MTIAEQILDYASKQGHPFHRHELMHYLNADNVPESSAHVILNRLVRQGELIKTGYGIYSFPEKGKRPFVYQLSDEEQTLSRQIRAKFPFTDFCTWKSSVLVPYMQHIPAFNMLFVDVERVAIESVFHFLQGNNPAMAVLLNPTVQECERYITTDKLLIVRILVKEAPITFVDKTPVPTLEKILVDAAGDKELSYVQGSELYTIYENAFNMNKVNISRLLRYATRRNRKDYVLKIINTIES